MFLRSIARALFGSRIAELYGLDNREHLIELSNGIKLRSSRNRADRINSWLDKREVSNLKGSMPA
jgi:hypothetical protein